MSWTKAGYVVVLFVLLIIADDVAASSTNDLRQQAIERLSRVFEVDRVPQQRFRRSPPEYMANLYDQVAYTDGISRSPNPYEADIVRGFLDKATFHQMHYAFNVSHLSNQEAVLEAELHLFKLRSPPPPPSSSDLHPSASLSHLRLYQVLDESAMHSPEGLRLLHQRRLSVHQNGWQIFKVGDTVLQWINDSSTNFGFLVTATLGTGHSVNETGVRFAQRGQHHDSKQPVLVTFTDRARSDHFALNMADSVERIDAPSLPGNGQLASARREYIRFLNEGFRAQNGGTPLRKIRHYMTPEMHRQLTTSTQMSNPALRHRSRRSSSTRSKKSKRSQANFNRFNRRKKKSCQRQELYVDFDEIGWSGWIISPKGYNAYHCKGACPFPLGQNQKPTNHATVQSIVHALRIGKEVEMPCCVPNKLFSISLLYFDDDENVILKQYDDMVAASCGCH
ncbi:hypothetical protein CAPTEDRAFT_184506 [Capitella teleta]|uniref:TGF-beta family profile domain-containing protein n=1 Tax=Capitella teleta TaxID=283909 RepID=R7U6R0_CAPTE|nr:hypothetical protein CAPTEDRAFT_184506 [Capitella teleta]|eukprot:ELU02050.1 hypothetical protein CAPTEDRAFT_184506 [Capitella teleta]